MIKEHIRDLVPHWVICFIVVCVTAGIHWAMVSGSTSLTILETNVKCKVVKIIPSNKSEIYLAVDCNGIVDNISGSETIIKWFENKKDFRCTTYADKSVAKCVLEE